MWPKCPEADKRLLVMSTDLGFKASGFWLNLPLPLLTSQHLGTSKIFQNLSSCHLFLMLAHKTQHPLSVPNFRRIFAEYIFFLVKLCLLLAWGKVCYRWFSPPGALVGMGIVVTPGVCAPLLHHPPDPPSQKRVPESQAPSSFTPGKSLNLSARRLSQLLTRGTVLFRLLS